MTPHDHRTFVPGCYRCDLGRDEVMSALALERDEVLELLERVYQAARNRGYVSSGLLNEIHDLTGDRPSPTKGDAA